MNQSPLRLCYSGASPDTGNLGVSALYYAVVGGLAKCDPRIDLTVFDEGSGLRRQTAEFTGRCFEYSLCGATRTRRIWQRRSFWNIRVSSWFGGLVASVVEPRMLDAAGASHAQAGPRQNLQRYKNKIVPVSE
jgi:hypothetical protein